MAIPGFTAEESLLKSTAIYGGSAAHRGATGTSVLLPQLTRVCSACSGLLRGTRYCCDIRITCNPWAAAPLFSFVKQKSVVCCRGLKAYLRALRAWGACCKISSHQAIGNAGWATVGVTAYDVQLCAVTNETIVARFPLRLNSARIQHGHIAPPTVLLACAAK